ncbi:MAG: M20/M25/M40 family metallo-hydrolase [bacterium]|nr:M20/M25/M40 family metallo-hydrolase [bacterium]MDE0352442.1 M20/M25/M40 family metallo-hydrolase [bacterium]
MGADGIALTAIDSVDLDLAVELCREVSRIPSVLGAEGPLAEFIAGTLRDLGFEKVKLQPVLADRSNAIGELSFGPGRRVVLTGHLDTKPVSHGWTVAEPYSGDLVNDRVYGHGIMDMKGALACQIAALAGLKDADLPLSGTAAFAAVSDHMGDQRGSIAYFEAYPADLCVLGELSESTICLGHRGRYYFDIHVYGRSAHTCHKHDAVNANYLAALAVIELDASRLEPHLEPWVAEMFGSETFMSPGRIYGGLPPGGPSMIPDECVIRVDCRPQPGVSKATVRAEIERALAAAAEKDPRFRAEVVLADEKPGHLVDRDSEVVTLIREAVRAARPGQEPSMRVEGWLGDTSSFGPLVETVIFGPGGEPVYAADENLSVEDIHDAAKVYAAFAALALSA